MRSWTLFLYPAGTAVGVREIGHREGRHGTFRAAALGAARGTLFAASVALLLGYGIGSVFRDDDDHEAVTLVGLAVVLLAPPYAAAGYAASDVQRPCSSGRTASAGCLALRAAL